MNMVYIANTSPEEKDVLHFGRKGQTWYVRNYQSYEVAPTRSGKVGVEYGDAAKSNDEEARSGENLELSKEELKELKRLEKQGVKYEKWKRKKLSNDKFVKKHFGELSNEEISYYIERKQLEVKINDLKQTKKQSRWSTLSKAMEAIGGGAVAFSKVAAAASDSYNSFDNIKKKGTREGPTPTNVGNIGGKNKKESDEKKKQNP